MRRAFTFVQFIISLGMLAIAIAVLLPWLTNKRDGPLRVSCQSNLKQIGLAVQQYAQDYDARFPPIVGANGQGWTKLTGHYLKSGQLFRCPAVTAVTKGNEVRNDYFYNTFARSLETRKLKYPAQTILMGDGPSDSSPYFVLPTLPVQWLKDPKSPAFRHLKGANYLFADGHVKWMTPEKIKSESPRKSGAYTFLPD